MAYTCKKFSQNIDSYFHGTLTEEMQEAFELHYFECDRCFTELKIVERLHSKEVSIVSPTPAKSRVWITQWKPVAVFGTILLAILASWFIIQQERRADMGKYYELTAFSAPTFVTKETRSLVTGSAERFAEAMDFYNKKDYARALERMAQIPDGSDNPQVLFFKGICLLLTDHLNPALTAFDSIIQKMDPSYFDEAIYFKAVTLLRLNRKEDGVKELNRLTVMYSPYTSKAKDLLAKIENM